MMADLMDQHMGDDGAQSLVMLGPVIEDGTAIEEDHVGEHPRMAEFLALGETGALEQAEQVELALSLHVVQHIVLREILYSEYNIAGEIVESLGQARIGLRGQRVEILERRRFEAAQFMQRKPVAWQISIPSAVIAFTVV